MHENKVCNVQCGIPILLLGWQMKNGVQKKLPNYLPTFYDVGLRYIAP